VVEHVLGGRPGVLTVEANPVAQTANVTFDPEQTSVKELRDWIEECGFHCAGQSVPGHICDPMAERGAPHAPHDHAAMERAENAHGHGHGGHAGMSMDSMVRDMRNRFLIALAFTIPIVLWSMVGTKLLGTELATPFGIDRDVWQLLLSLPVVLYASSIFFRGRREQRVPANRADLREALRQFVGAQRARNSGVCRHSGSSWSGWLLTTVHPQPALRSRGFCHG